MNYNRSAPPEQRRTRRHKIIELLKERDMSRGEIFTAMEANGHKVNSNCCAKVIASLMSDGLISFNNNFEYTWRG